MDRIEDDPTRIYPARPLPPISLINAPMSYPDDVPGRLWVKCVYESEAMEIVGGLDWEMRELVSEG